MPIYIYHCPEPECKEQIEVRLPVLYRDSHVGECPTHGKPFTRRITAPMATLWRGQFHSPWAKKAEGDW